MVALGRDRLAIVPHEILAMAQMRPVVVHHVAEEAVEEIEAALRRARWSEVPLADARRRVAHLLQ